MAAGLGYASGRQLLAGRHWPLLMGELREWLAYRRLEPFGPAEDAKRAWYQTLFCHSGERPPKLKDLYPELAPDPEAEAKRAAKEMYGRLRQQVAHGIQRGDGRS